MLHASRTAVQALLWARRMLMAARPFALVWGALMWVAATVLGHESALAQTDEIYTRGEDRGGDGGDGPTCLGGSDRLQELFGPPDKYPAGDLCAGTRNTRGYYVKCGPSCNAKWMYCYRQPQWAGPPPACDTISTISGDEPPADGSSPPSPGQDTVSTDGGGSGSGGESGSSGGFVCKPPDTLPPKERWRWYQAHCLAQTKILEDTSTPKPKQPQDPPRKRHNAIAQAEPLTGKMLMDGINRCVSAVFSAHKQCYKDAWLYRKREVALPRYKTGSQGVIEYHPDKLREIGEEYGNSYSAILLAHETGRAGNAGRQIRPIR